MHLKKWMALGLGVICINPVLASSDDAYKTYCHDAGGAVLQMPAEFSTHRGMVRGQKKAFCTFDVNGGFIAVGLETFASEVPSIAATYIKKLTELSSSSSLWHGTYANPSQNVCKNLGGSAIGFVSNGGFANQLGQSDVCVFGDGSMVSAWSLIYMANHREGYDEIKALVRAEPLPLDVPH